MTLKRNMFTESLHSDGIRKNANRLTSRGTEKTHNRLSKKLDTEQPTRHLILSTKKELLPSYATRIYMCVHEHLRNDLLLVSKFSRGVILENNSCFEFDERFGSQRAWLGYSFNRLWQKTFIYFFKNKLLHLSFPKCFGIWRAKKNIYRNYSFLCCYSLLTLRHYLSKFLPQTWLRNILLQLVISFLLKRPTFYARGKKSDISKSLKEILLE